jgi:hypothetical protein
MQGKPGNQPIEGVGDLGAVIRRNVEKSPYRTTEFPLPKD